MKTVPRPRSTLQTSTDSALTFCLPRSRQLVGLLQFGGIAEVFLRAGGLRFAAAAEAQRCVDPRAPTAYPWKGSGERSDPPSPTISRSRALRFLGLSVQERAARGNWDDFDRIMARVPAALPFREMNASAVSHKRLL